MVTLGWAGYADLRKARSTADFDCPSCSATFARFAATAGLRVLRGGIKSRPAPSRTFCAASMGAARSHSS